MNTNGDSLNLDAHGFSDRDLNVLIGAIYAIIVDKMLPVLLNTSYFQSKIKSELIQEN